MNPPKADALPRSTSGFALIESLVALTILSFLLSLLVYIYIHTLKVVEAGEKRASLEMTTQIVLDHLVNEITQSNLLLAKLEEVRIGVYEKVGEEEMEILGKGKFLRPIYEERPVTYGRKDEELLRNGKRILPPGVRVKTFRFNYWGYDPIRLYKGRVDFDGLDHNQDGELSQGEEGSVTMIQVVLEVSKGSYSVFLQTSKRMVQTLGDAVVRRKG